MLLVRTRETPGSVISPVLAYSDALKHDSSRISRISTEPLRKLWVARKLWESCSLVASQADLRPVTCNTAGDVDV